MRVRHDKVNKMKVKHSLLLFIMIKNRTFREKYYKIYSKNNVNLNNWKNCREISFIEMKSLPFSAYPSYILAFTFIFWRRRLATQSRFWRRMLLKNHLISRRMVVKSSSNKVKMNSTIIVIITWPSFLAERTSTVGGTYRPSELVLIVSSFSTKKSGN